jgi:hypothetical protein
MLHLMTGAAQPGQETRAAEPNSSIPRTKLATAEKTRRRKKFQEDLPTVQRDEEDCGVSS